MDHTVNWASLEAGDAADAAMRAEWLEKKLVGLDLARTIDELAVIVGEPVNRPEVSLQAIRSWLGSDATAVLERGLGCLPVTKLNELFLKPSLLAGLQELVLLEGGACWDARVRAGVETSRQSAADRRVLVRRLDLGSGFPEEVGTEHEADNALRQASGPPVVARIGRRLLDGHPGRRGFLLIPLMAAAAVAFLIVGSEESSEPPHPDAGQPERVVIGNAPSPAPNPAGDEDRQATEVSWPEHPWESLAATPSSGAKTILAGPQQEWLVEARQWSQALEQSADLSTAQVLAAAARARGAVEAVGSLTDAVRAGVAPVDSGRLRKTCSTVVDELDRLHRDIETAPSDDSRVTKAKLDIVRALRTVESALGGEGPATDGDPTLGIRPE